MTDPMSAGSSTMPTHRYGSAGEAWRIPCLHRYCHRCEEESSGIVDEAFAASLHHLFALRDDAEGRLVNSARRLGGFGCAAQVKETRKRAVAVRRQKFLDPGDELALKMNHNLFDRPIVLEFRSTYRRAHDRQSR